MEPTNIRFGGGAATTILHPLVAVALLITVILTCFAPRKYVLAPWLLTALLVPFGQVVVLGGVHFTVYRIIVLFGLVRLIRTAPQTGGHSFVAASVALTVHLRSGLCLPASSFQFSGWKCRPLLERWISAGRHWRVLCFEIPHPGPRSRSAGNQGDGGRRNRAVDHHGYRATQSKECLRVTRRNAGGSRGARGQATFNGCICDLYYGWCVRRYGSAVVDVAMVRFEIETDRWSRSCGRNAYDDHR